MTNQLLIGVFLTVLGIFLAYIMEHYVGPRVFGEAAR